MEFPIVLLMFFSCFLLFVVTIALISYYKEEQAIREKQEAIKEKQIENYNRTYYAPSNLICNYCGKTVTDIHSGYICHKCRKPYHYNKYEKCGIHDEGHYKTVATQWGYSPKGDTLPDVTYKEIWVPPYYSDTCTICLSSPSS